MQVLEATQAEMVSIRNCSGSKKMSVDLLADSVQKRERAKEKKERTKKRACKRKKRAQKILKQFHSSVHQKNH